jgi:fatty-acyl-CoA synthase
MLARMETPLSPLDLMRRTRRLYPHHEAVVDGELRLSYEQFFARCDRWSSVLQRQLGVRQGDRVAYIAPNTHAQLTSYYAVPQLGAVLVPINYRLTADDFTYIINHSGSKVVCAHSDYLETVDRIRDQLTGVVHFVALEGARDGWLDYEQLIAAASGEFTRPEIGERDLLTINYTSGTTAQPKGVMITHRNAYMNVLGTILHVPMAATTERYLWTLPMFHANGWTFVWTITAVGGTHVCLRRVEPPRIFAELARERITMLCAAPTVLIGIASAPADLRRGAPAGVRVLTAGAPPAAATINRVEQDLGWVVTHVYGLTETAPFITVCEPRPEHAGLAPADRAVVHPDGYVEVRDRIKDVIISGGENISSVEVEGVLLRHPAVQEVAVVGMPSEKWGESPHAFVILRAGASATEDELRAFIREQLAHFKCPQAFHFVTELPKTATGKIQKFVLRGRRAGISAQ